MVLVPSIKFFDGPLKLLIKDIKKIQNCDDEGYPWKITLPNILAARSVINFKQVWIQGEIKTLDSKSDSITLSDGTGELKVILSSRVPGEGSWMEPGVYCGLLASVHQLAPVIPIVSAVKLMHIQNEKCAKEMWPLEVQELSNLLMDKIAPRL